MTTTYDPHHPRYLDDGDVRAELARVFDVCGACRRCVDLCGAFPTLFSALDAGAGAGAGALSAAQQDAVVDECFQCGRCALDCPYTPARSPQAVDVPRLLRRARAVRTTTGDVPHRRRRTTRILARTDRLGRLGTMAAPLVNAATARPGSPVRRVLARATGVSAQRVLPPFTRQRFSTWFRKRPRVRLAQRQATIAVFPTCVVEYHQPAIGKDLVKVYERNGIECSLVDGARCCGAPWLHAGELEAFTAQAAANVRALAAAVRGGHDVVVPQPTCGLVLRRDYVDHVGGPDAALVASRTFDAAEYLVRIHHGDGTRLSLDFHGDVPDSVTYHAPCHLRAQEVGLRSRDLIRLTGARVRVVAECSGIDGLWGLRAENDERSRAVREKLARAVAAAGGEVVAGDCHLANGVIVETTGRVPVHPVQVLARAYGIPEE